MRVTVGQIQHIAMLTEAGGQTAIKKLDQTERKAIQAMMKALQNKDTYAEIELGKQGLANLTNKLWVGIGSHKTGSSWFLIRCIKGFANLFFDRISSKDLSEQVSAAYKEMSKQDAAKELRNWISPLVSTKELILDYYENKVPKAAVLVLFGKNHELEKASEQFENELQEAINQFIGATSLWNALRLGFNVLTSSELQKRYSEAKVKFENISVKINDTKTTDNKQMDAIFMEELFGSPNATKTYCIDLLDDLIGIIKEMYSELAKCP